MRWLVLLVVVVIGVLFWYDRSGSSVQIGQSGIETPISLITPSPTFAPTPDLLEDITSEIHNKLNGVWKQENGVSRLEFGRVTVFPLADFVDGTRSGNGTLYEKVDGDSNTYENTYKLTGKKNTWELHINWRRTSTSATYSYDVKGNTLILTDIATNEQYIYWNAGQLKGVWAGVGNSERLEFRDDGTLSRTLGESSKEYTYRLFDYDHLSITWRPRPLFPSSSPRPFALSSSYQYELKDNRLILTDDTGGRFVYLRELEPTKLGRQTGIGPHPVTISGRLVGPTGVLGNQIITLNGNGLCGGFQSGFRACEVEVAQTTTDPEGKFRFQDVAPEDNYSLSFVFNVANPDQIPHQAPVGAFVLSKSGLEITATSNDFYLTGFEDEKIIDFIYPSTPPPTITPSPVPATPATPSSPSIQLPTSTPIPIPTARPIVNCDKPSERTDVHNPITFINMTNHTVEINWVNFEGQEVHYDDLAPGGKIVENTYINHTWCVRDKQTKVALLFTSATEANQVARVK